MDDGFDTSTDIGHTNPDDAAYYQLINFTTDLAVSVVEPQPPGTDGETIDRLRINGEPYNLAGGGGGAAQFDELLSRPALAGDGVSGRYYELGHPGTIADTDLLQIVGSGSVAQFMSPMFSGSSGMMLFSSLTRWSVTMLPVLQSDSRCSMGIKLNRALEVR